MSALDVLSEPVRLRVVRRLASGPAATLDELAAHAEVHANTVRRHVTELERAGMVERERQDPQHPRPPGRPLVRYRLSDRWRPPTADFLGLAELLALTLARIGAGLAELRLTGLAWGRWLLGRPGHHAVEQELPRALEALGFDARLREQELELASCPCPLVSPGRPEMVCELAMAVADGVLEGAGSGLRVGARRHDPGRRACGATLARG